MEIMIVEDAKKEELKTEATDLETLATEVNITTQEQYLDAVALLDLNKEFRVKVKELWDPVCDSTNKAHKSATTGRNSQDAPFLKIEKLLKPKLEKWNRDQEELRRIEAKRIQEEEDEAARLLKEEEDRLLEEAVTYEDAGDKVKAEEMIAEAQEIQEHRERRPVYTPPPIDRGGMSFRDNWKAVVLDPKAVPREYCIPNQTALDALAKERAGGPAPSGVKFINSQFCRQSRMGNASRKRKA